MQTRYSYFTIRFTANDKNLHLNDTSLAGTRFLKMYFSHTSGKQALMQAGRFPPSCSELEISFMRYIQKFGKQVY
jgi:hypothetical protein